MPEIKVTVDAVVFRKSDTDLEILLIRRKNPPFKGQWALPGGFVEPDENLETAARRELKEETGLKPEVLRQLKAYGEPGRDPRGPTVTIAHYSVIADEESIVRGASDANEARWFNVENLPETGFDHALIIHDALDKVI